MGLLDTIKAILTGTGVEKHKGGRVVVTGQGEPWKWKLLSGPNINIQFKKELCECWCENYGKVLVPKPAMPASIWRAYLNRFTLTVQWRSDWDADDDGRLGSSDLARFAFDYHRLWHIRDFAQFAALWRYGKSDLEWVYERERSNG